MNACTWGPSNGHLLLFGRGARGVRVRGQRVVLGPVSFREGGFGERGKSGGELPRYLPTYDGEGSFFGMLGFGCFVE